MKSAKNKEPYKLSEAECQLLEAGLDNPNLLTGYFCRKPGEEMGWQFDANFTEDGAWQLDACIANQTLHVIVGGVGCSDIDSRIYDAELRRYITFRELIITNREPVVLSKTNTGWRKIKASIPYYKGTDEMVRVHLSDGNVSDVSLAHRFLTPSGDYVYTRDLRVGDTLVAPRNLPSTSSDEIEDVLHCSEKASNFQDCCSSHYCRCDVPPRCQLVDALILSPSQDDVPQPIHSTSCDPGSPLGQEQKHTYHPCDQHKFHQRMPDSIHLLVRHPESGLPLRWREISDAPVRPELEVQEPQQFSENSIQYWQDVLSEEYIDLGSKPSYDNLSCQVKWDYSRDYSCLSDEDTAYLQNHRFELDVSCSSGSPDWCDYYTPIITKIEHLSVRDLYDIHVPVWNNYVMDGVVSHNTGKTIGIAAGAIVWALTTPDFKFLNIGKELHQAKYVYKEIANFCQGTLLGKLVYTMRESPTPYIEFRFYIGERLMRSTFEFFGLGDDADAMNIFSWRGDWINIEECGRIDNLAEIAGNLQTRLTGAINNRSYIGRLSMISNPIDNADMWNLFDLALQRPDKVLSISVSTLHNKNVSDDQVESMRMIVPEGKQEAYILGARTDPQGGFYDRATVAACGSDAMTELIKSAHDSKIAGYTIVDAANLGWVHFETPYSNDRDYAIFGDPGIGAPPARNAPVLSVWDVSNPKIAARLVAFWWGNGGGKIEPFVEKLIYFIGKYHPIVAGIDSTSTQKYLAEMLTVDRISGKGYSIEYITPMDFSGSKKMGYLAALRIAMEDKKLLWPSAVKGVKQITGYDPSRDTANSKLPQDIVSCFSSSASGIRRYWASLPDDGSEEVEKSESLIIDGSGIIRRDRDSAPLSRWTTGERSRR